MIRRISLLFFVALVGTALAANLERLGKIRLGGTFPNRVGIDLTKPGSELISPEEILNENGTRYVLISFFRTDCAPCLKEIGELSQRREDLKAKGIEVLLVGVKEDGPEMRRLLRQRGWNFRAIADRFEGDYSHQCGVINAKEELELPTTVLVGRGKGGMVMNAAWQGGESGIVDRVLEMAQ